MEVTKISNLSITGNHNKPILSDLYFKDNEKPKAIVIFCHGYKGFKDWGAWDQMAEAFAKEDYFFVKFNFSHNGTTPENLTEFLNIEAFGDNNFVIELDDLQSVIDWITAPSFKFKNQLDTNKITLIGHSRGGGITTIKAAEEARITKLITLAAVSDFGSRFPDEEALKVWKEKGVQYITNTRTKQQLPHHYQFYENFIENEERLNIQRAAENLKIPHLIIHGSGDTSVSISNAGHYFDWSPNAKLLLIDNADHVFGISQPWEQEHLPEEFQQCIAESINFLKGDIEGLQKPE